MVAVTLAITVAVVGLGGSALWDKWCRVQESKQRQQRQFNSYFGD